MVDIIGNKGFSQLQNVSRTGKPAGAQKSANNQSADRVDFSSALKNATKTQATSSAQEATRAEKLQALKGQIENGSYRPDLNKVAASILPFIINES